MQNKHIEILNRCSFYIRKASSELMPQNWVLHTRQLLDHELLYVEQGEIVCTIDSKEYTIREKEILLIPPSKIHSFYTTKTRLIQSHMHFDFFYNELSPKRFISFGKIDIDDPAYYLMEQDIYEELDIPYHITLDPISTKTVRLLISAIVSLQTSNEITSVLAVKRHMVEIFEIILKKYLPVNAKSSEEEALFNHVNIMIEQQINSSLDWGKIALEAGYSENYLASQYKKRYGYTPLTYHTSIRVAQAKSYLTNQNLSVSEIAGTMGFEAIADFSRYFKRVVGVSPKQFKIDNKHSSRC